MNLPDEIESQKNAINVEWLATKLNVSPKTLYKMAKRGRIPSFRIGYSVRFNPKAVADWLRRRMSD
jgi:excisionase family DNA binding protein